MTEDATSVGRAPSVYERLATRFPVEAHKRVRKGGREQTYIPWTDKVERFNEVLGHDWSFRIIREGMTDTEAWVLGELSVTIDGVTTVRQQYGCEAVTRGKDATPVTDLFKIAGTDALSKAATLYGCGLYLSIQEERAEVEAEMRQGPKPKAPAGAAPSLDDARKAAVVTGADPNKQPAGLFCVECHGLVKTDGTVTIPKSKKNPGVTVTVPVLEFAPVCEARLGGFHCPGCYTDKWIKAA